MKKFIATILTLCIFITTAFAQISVKSFEELPFDLDASTHYPKKDANNQQCAIIKIFTTQKGFSFDNGTLGIVDVEYDDVKHAAEIWVYVPESTMKLKISHPQLGHIQNSQYNDGFYWFPRVKAGKCYKMELTSGTVRTIVEEAQQQTGWLILNSEPEDAEVWLCEEGGEEKYYSNTPFQKKMAYGRYFFRLKKAKYHDERGVAEIKQAKVSHTIPLLPAFGSISVTSTPQGALVYLNGESTGKTTPCTLSEVVSGEYDLRLHKDNYAPQSCNVTVSDGQTTPVDMSLSARFASITIKSLPGASIKINDTHKGNSSFTDNLTEGFYDIEASLAGHRSAKSQIEVLAGTPKTIELFPTPIYGKLDVITTPMEAEITIDGKSYGTTPNTIEKILIGTHDVTLSKNGYTTTIERITISENTTSTININLKKTTSQQQPATQTPKPEKIKQGSLEPIWAANISPNVKSLLTHLINNMVKVEGGTFTMGATREQGNGAADEKPTHRVTLDTYYIGRYEVTQAVWEAVMGNNPASHKGDLHPIESISWETCQTFINRLKELTGLNFSLPTEAQWEYAARGGKKSKGYKYSGSNHLKSVAWYWDNSKGTSGRTTHSVGKKLANELGLFDMNGNVEEMCSDWYGSYTDTAQTNPTGATSGTYKVLRGKCYIDFKNKYRISARNTISPTISGGGFVGFRLVIN